MKLEFKLLMPEKLQEVKIKLIKSIPIICYKYLFIYLINELKSTTNYKFGLIVIKDHGIALCVVRNGLRFNAM